MFNMPLETVLFILSWPIIWMLIAFIMFFKLKKEDEQEGLEE
jgi:hypothetical protein